MILARRILAVIIVIAFGAIAFHWYKHTPRSVGPTPQQAYIWQRAWTPALQDSIRTSSPNLKAYVALAAEVSFHSGHLDIVRVPVDYSVLKNANIPTGIALRVGAYSGSFAADDATATRITDLAASLISDAQAAGVSPAELQIDFDCAESKLDGYRVWIEAIKRRVAPVPVTITALPAWLSQPAFVPLVQATAGYVLQVHSLHRPMSIDAPMTLCDADAARRWVEQAGRIGVPFRVALPTYGYLVAFDENGIFKGLSAEGPSLDWPERTQVRALRADPAAMADLVNAWNADRPPCMIGVIWYRLPTADDTLNWRWVTLQSVMGGRAPRANVSARVVKSEPGLCEVQLCNEGQADAPLGPLVTVRWRGAALVAADGLGGYEQSNEHGSEISNLRSRTFSPLPSIANERLAPGDRRIVAWLRLSEDKEVHADVSSKNP